MESYERVFPTLVGVFLLPEAQDRRPGSLPHARGGVSWRDLPWPELRSSSPRSWGCFYAERGWKAWQEVFPTLVGVFLFVKPAFAFDASLPHARGGVSFAGELMSKRTRSSPRSWGCFQLKPTTPATFAVFPTLVGVFLVRFLAKPLRNGLPHARGGVSTVPRHSRRRGSSSPRSWGCFSR